MLGIYLPSNPCDFIKRLKEPEFKADIIENGASFTSKAVLYSDDIASRKTGGLYTLNRKRPQRL